MTAQGGPQGEPVVFGIEVGPGQAVELFGPQVEPQPGASTYKPSTSGGIYENARLRDDYLAYTTTGPNCHNCTVNILHVQHR